MSEPKRIGYNEVEKQSAELYGDFDIMRIANMAFNEADKVLHDFGFSIDYLVGTAKLSELLKDQRDYDRAVTARLRNVADKK